MAFDGVFLNFVKNDIADFAIGARVDKVYLPTRYELVLALRTRSETKRLFISVSGNAPRVNFTDYSPENPVKPPMLCMLLRKQLIGAIITDVRQQGLDRVLYIDFNASNEIGDRVKRTLVIEIMAQYSNCILLDETDCIIDAMKRVDSSKSSFREVLPQTKYVMPPQQDKLNPLTCSEQLIFERILSYSDKLLSAAFLSSVSGVSPVVSKELAYRVCLSDIKVCDLTEEMKSRLLHEVCFWTEFIKKGQASPNYIVNANGDYAEFSYMPLTLYIGTGKAVKAESLSQMLDIYYVEREKLARAKSKAEDLFRFTDKLIERTSKKLNIQSEELALCGEMESKRVFAELINANLYSLKKGTDEYTVQNYYDNYNEIKIPVLPHLSPVQNSQRYFKEYRKAQTAKKVLAEQIEKGNSDLTYLLSVKDALSRAQTEQDIGEIRAELSEGGYLKRGTGSKNKKNSALQPLKFNAPDGFTLLIGRNNMQNDRLTFKIAAKNDIWFHVQKAPGSHVVLITDNNIPTPKALEFAASAAVYYSSVKERGMAEVDYTKVKNLKKPPAAHPGFVIYHIYESVYVKAENPENKY